MKRIVRHEDLSREEAIRAAIEALIDAADEDRATGGIDVVRGIFPTVKIATRSGVEDVKDDELKRIHEAIAAERRAA